MNVVFPKYKEAVLSGAANSAINGSGATGLYVALIDTSSYTFNSAHEFYSSLSGVVGTDQEILSASVINGLLDGSNVTFPAVIGASAEALVIYRKNAGASSTWRLVAYMDTDVVGLPVVPNGGDIMITWNAAGIVQF